MTRDEIAALLNGQTDLSAGQSIALADRILALLPPREPTPAMVEAMAQAMFEFDPAFTGTSRGAPRWTWEMISDEMREYWSAKARAAWAAGYAKGEER